MKSGTNRGVSTATMILTTLLLGACATGTEPSVAEQHGRNVLIVADPQLHNIHGLSLKQMAPVADWFIGVAIRPPELNILAPLVLDHAIDKGLASKPDVMLVLGDVGNIGCSGEMEQFQKIVHERAGSAPPVIMAHGNHDTYLMGTMNSFIPAERAQGWKPPAMGNSAVPTDESWWDRPTSSTPMYPTSWRDGCYQPDTDSAPMNKSRWLAKYLASLAKWGMVQQRGGSAATANPVALRFEATPGTPLGNMQYKAEGMWHRPTFGDTPSKSDFIAAYRSFIVQRFDLDKTSTIVIDTSVCENARGNAAVLFTNAGTWACIGREQFDTIERMVRQIPSDHRLVIASHFPMRGLGLLERLQLLQVLDGRNNWAYLSAHTHHAKSETPYGHGREINMGSTTDWPMEWNMVRYPDGAAFPSAKTAYVRGPEKIGYAFPAVAEARFEVCRHLAAAEQLANLDPAAPLEIWQSPSKPVDCEVDSREKWAIYSKRLSELVNKIHTRYRNDEKGYRARVLAIAAAASEAESRRFSVVP